LGPIDCGAAPRDGELELQFYGVDDHPVHGVPTYRFRMIHAESREELGGTNLRSGTTPHIERYAGHVGFSVHPAHRGHRYASRALALLVPIAARLKFERLWITCDPENAASRRSLELAGARFVEMVDVPADRIIYKTGHPRKCRYRIDLNGAGAEDRALIRQALEEHLSRLHLLENEECDRRGYQAQPQRLEEYLPWEETAVWPED
jgi:tagatose 1,6-diphosphate aldolase